MLRKVAGVEKKKNLRTRGGRKRGGHVGGGVDVAQCVRKGGNQRGGGLQSGEDVKRGSPIKELDAARGGLKSILGGTAMKKRNRHAFRSGEEAADGVIQDEGRNLRKRGGQVAKVRNRPIRPIRGRRRIGMAVRDRRSFEGNPGGEKLMGTKRKRVEKGGAPFLRKRMGGGGGGLKQGK